MSSFESTVLLFGSCASLSGLKIRLPVSTMFVFDVESLNKLVEESVDLSESSLPRYFLVLFQSIDEKVVQLIEKNHRFLSIYHFYCHTDWTKNSFEQLTLDLTTDIIRFLTNEGKKQIQLERLSLVKMYFHQARVLKDWAMALFKVKCSSLICCSGKIV